MALPIKLVSKARHRVGPSGYCHEDFPIFAWRPTLAFFVAFHLEFPPVRSAPDSGRSTGNFDRGRMKTHRAAEMPERACPFRGRTFDSEHHEDIES